MKHLEIQFSFGLAIGAVIAAGINAYFNYRSEQKRVKQQREENANIVVGELLNVIAHYTQYQSVTFRMVDGDERDIIKVKTILKEQIYGNFLAVSKPENVSFLPPEQIRNLYQLAIRIRNADSMINEFIAACTNPDNCTDYELKLYEEYDLFMGYVEDAASGVLLHIEHQFPEFKGLIPEDKLRNLV
ncbi:hypothetical protein [Vibrio parahaemolyticus]|uniref:hypothetical protein n=1 Tax=Vibrio parahaemolyticus TaxID=670 RepID=UPI0007A02BD1|nr:hypothetical protein [Vibrio parahaemolyticus]EGQ7741012.1 hypothetical protein [Vibrio parahaemolyticus]EIO3966788.1 hypothetical protein [Vibrio parahaemolyticus]EIO3989655.1 hypothetical protein [Vibrio parahaemolyticus]EJG1399094.1 hypothetical protein [Vibrio parahaemolyticus]ELA9842072.1 hypothetical protein [Vibrio parahaemolyticus]